ncbi:MAG TPA: hypothetical protein VFX43_06970 [Chitinophagaceae bacterium]|nr:hypothetical protein [Chitinophagaceae bacterium]
MVFRKTLLTVVIFLSVYEVLYGQADTLLNRYREYLFQTENPGNTAKLMNTLDAHRAWPDIDYTNISRSF